MKSRQLLIVLLLFTLGFTSCGLSEQPVSEPEALQFARTIENSIARKNPAVMNTVLDIPVFVASVEKNTKQKLDASVREGMQSSIEKKALGAQIIQAAGDDGSYKLLRSYEKNGRRHLLFRLYGPAGLNYHDIELVKRNNRLKAADIFIYYSGEPFSLTIGNLLKQLTDNLSDETEKESIARMRKIQDMIAQKDFIGAKAEYADLPKALKEQRTFMLIYIGICSGLNDESLYLQSIEEYQQHFPNETNVPLLMIDACIMHKDYNKALQAVNTLDKLVGTDPFLDYYRGLVYAKMGDTANYRTSIEKLYQYMPGFQDGAVELISVYLDGRDYDKARPVIATFRTHPKWKQQILNLVILQKPGLPEDIRAEATRVGGLDG